MFGRQIDKKALKATVVVVGTLLALGTAACSSSSTPSSSESPSASSTASVGAVHNDADIEFAQKMIPHHEQAIVMAQMVPSRSQNPQLNKLAKQIEAAQAPEIAQMKSWLAAWGAPESTGQGSMDGHGSMGDGSMGDGSMGDGMMTPEQMTQMENSSGAAFDKMWLQMMIEHHEGAVDMSKAELANGENPQAKALAASIAKSQTTEIAEMSKLLSQ